MPLADQREAFRDNYEGDGGGLGIKTSLSRLKSLVLNIHGHTVDLQYISKPAPPKMSGRQKK